MSIDATTQGPKTIALPGSFDTKGAEYAFVRDCIHAQGFRTLAIDTGVLDASTGMQPDIGRAEVAAAGGADIAQLAALKDRGTAMAAMARGLQVLLPKLFAQKRFDGVLALGGGSGTSTACNAMRALPLGVPKVMVSTLAGTDVAHYVGGMDIVMYPSIVDIAGINRISREILARAAGAVCGMTAMTIPVPASGQDNPLIAASMFGNTTQCVNHARGMLEKSGYEVLVFHATGTGGRTLENVVQSGRVAGVLDVTTTEWADELIGGVLAAGPTRLEAAAKTGSPAVIAPGCLDMVNFWKPHSVPEKFKGRNFYPHNPDVTLMRTNAEENRRLGEIIASKVNMSSAPVSVLLPLKGLSMLDAPGERFWSPEADSALFTALKTHLRKDIPVIELNCNINAPEFAEQCVAELLKNISLKNQP